MFGLGYSAPKNLEADHLRPLEEALNSNKDRVRVCVCVCMHACMDMDVDVDVDTNMENYGYVYVHVCPFVACLFVRSFICLLSLCMLNLAPGSGCPAR